jgi:hypothetical protein
MLLLSYIKEENGMSYEEFKFYAFIFLMGVIVGLLIGFAISLKQSKENI